jgi:hypothetical protein
MKVRDWLHFLADKDLDAPVTILVPEETHILYPTGGVQHPACPNAKEENNVVIYTKHREHADD